MTAEHLTKQAEIAESGFRTEELCDQDFTGSVVLHAQSGESWAATFEPVMRAAIQLHEFAEPCGTHAAVAMAGARRFLGGPRPCLRKSRRSVSRLSERPSRSTSFSQRW